MNKEGEDLGLISNPQNILLHRMNCVGLGIESSKLGNFKIELEYINLYSTNVNSK